MPVAMGKRRDTFAPDSQQRIMRLLQNRRFEEALRITRKATAEDPRNAGMWLLQASAHAGTGELEGVVDCCNRVLALEADNTAALYNLGVACQALGRSTDAIAAYESLLQLSPGNAAAHNNLAVLFAGMGRTDAAVRHYSKSLEIAPNNASTCNNLGLVLQQDGNPGAAAECFTRALALDPGNAAISLKLGRVLAAAGRNPEALAIDPGYLPSGTCRMDWSGGVLVSQGAGH